jgi:hypothetical protein
VYSRELNTAAVAAAQSYYITEEATPQCHLRLLKQSCVRGAATTGHWKFRVTCSASKSGNKAGFNNKAGFKMFLIVRVDLCKLN